MTTTNPIPPLPAPVAATTPAWLIKLVALAVACVGVALSWWNPLHLSTAGAKALIVTAFLVVAAVIFTVHFVLAAVHEHGFTLAALHQVETEESAALKQLGNEIVTQWPDARLALEQIPGMATAVSTATSDLTALHQKVDALPVDQLAAIGAALQSFAVPAAEPTTAGPLVTPTGESLTGVVAPPA